LEVLEPDAFAVGRVEEQVGTRPCVNETKTFVGQTLNRTFSQCLSYPLELAIRAATHRCRFPEW
ncbi:MAG: hypothetical protein R3336_07330, partial [Phycisphaeraceae bacterium]|nr:hypothetical protein [Phycisphaeraceae bacterium]